MKRSKHPCLGREDQAVNDCLVLKGFEIAWLGHGSKRPTSGVLYYLANTNMAYGTRWNQHPQTWYQCPWYRKLYQTRMSRWHLRDAAMKKFPIA